MSGLTKQATPLAVPDSKKKTLTWSLLHSLSVPSKGRLVVQVHLGIAGPNAYYVMWAIGYNIVRPK